MNQPRRRRFVLATLAGAFLALAITCLVAPDFALPVIWARSALLWVFLPAWGLLGLALLRRDRVAATLAGAVVLCHVGWVLPTVIPDVSAQAPAAPRMRVVAANVLYVNETPEVLLEELLATDADVVILEEVSPRWVALLDGDAARAVFPYRDVLGRDDAFGIALLSRHPIDRSELVDLVGVPMLDATVRVAGTELRVFGVHTLPPVDRAYADVWRDQLALLRDRVRAVDGPLVVAGDFNATLFHDGIRDLQRAGVADVSDALGRGLASTWPNGVFPAPPVALDHVFVSPELRPVRIHEGVGAGSDHRPLIVDLAPRGA
ncbi:MAG: endonuclease/exonuclease/phosphatase family protein [Sandaracinaceae bacterium]|nr:endonuclease/exonuclease/phosphatase family protein [Sandaracinaceae bacterium]